MTILIPTFEPDNRLLNLINDLKNKSDYNIILVDDGSGKSYENIFNTAKNLGCKVLSHSKNMGKGCAIKTGVKYVLDFCNEDGIVAADSDGQHKPDDIIKIAQKLKFFNNHLIIGSRHFPNEVPLKSKLGNLITRQVFYLSTGKKIYDTQTGLRGFPSNMFAWLLKINGNRFEYEMNMLLEAESAGYEIYEEEIETVYHIVHSTHFRPIKDSIQVYMPIIKFSISSIISGALDYGLLFLIQFITRNLFAAVVLARLCSSTFNYSMNKLFVFSKGKNCNVSDSIAKYYILMVIILILNYSTLNLLYYQLGLPLLLAKIITELLLFSFSFWTQRKFVFKLHKNRAI